MENKTRVLIVHNYYQIPGGEDTVVANEMQLLESNGHEVILYCRNNSEIETFSILQKLLLPISMLFNLRTYREVKAIIKETHIDVVHAHNTLNLISPSVYYAALHCNVPVVQTIHNFRLQCPGATLYRDGYICEDCIIHGLKCSVRHGCYRGSKLQTLVCVISTKLHCFIGTYRKLNYICLTDFNKDKLLLLNRTGKRRIINPDNVFVKPNFTFSHSLEKSVDEYYLFIGRIEKIKGLDVLITAFSQLPNQKLMIAGNGIDFEYYTRLAASLNAYNIQFLGFLSGDQLNNVLSKAKAVVVTSQVYETFGMVVIEAFSSHLPVIVGDIGNVGSLVEEGITGLKFKYNSSTALVQAINRFESILDNNWGERAYAEFLRDYSPHKNYEMLKRIYRQLN